jgi:hypothetical protein
MKLELLWTTCLLVTLIALVSVKSHNSIKTLEARVALLEKAAEATIEIHVERAFDADMGVYDYQLVGKSGEASSKIKRGRKRMSQRSKSQRKETF